MLAPLNSCIFIKIIILHFHADLYKEKRTRSQIIYRGFKIGALK